MVNELISAGMQYQKMNFANQYAAAVISKVKSMQEVVGAEAVGLIENATHAVSADPDVGQNIDVVV